MSRILPLIWVGWSISWVSELSKTKSQKALDAGEVVESESQLMSGKLKSPVIMVSVDELDWTICVRIQIMSFI